MKIIISENILNKKVAVIKTSQDVLITNSIHEKYDYDLSGVATFNQDVLLYRGLSSAELYDIIINNRRIKGGIFSTKIESRMGASFAFDKEEAVKAANAKRAYYDKRLKDFKMPDEIIIINNNKKRLKGDKFIITVNANQKQFLHIKLQEYIPNKEGKYSIDGDIGNLGLGFSVRGVYKKDILKIEMVTESGLVDVSNNIKSVLQKYHDERVTGSWGFMEGFDKLPIKDEDFAKLSPEALKKYIERLKGKVCDIEELTPFQIKKIGKEKFSELIDYFNSYAVPAYFCWLSNDFFFKYLSPEQKSDYCNQRWWANQNVTKSQEDWYNHSEENEILQRDNK